MAVPKASFRHGDPIMIDYTAGAAYTAGDIVLAGNTTGLTNIIAHRDVANGENAGFAAGGGVYNVKVASNYAAFTKVYWDAANSVLTSTSTNMSQFGYTVEASAAANAVVQVFHHPRA